MSKKCNTSGEAEVLLSWGDTIAVARKKLGVSEYTYYRWRKEYGGMGVGTSILHNILNN
jgi:hypothetical protein